MRPDTENSEHNGDSARASTRQKEIDGDVYSLDFAIRKSIRYHSKRRRFFDFWHDICSAITAITGSSAFMAILSDNHTMILDHPLPLYLAAIVALTTSCDLVFGFSKRSQQHDNLQRRFSSLLRQILTNEPTSALVCQWKAERAEIEQDEPTFLTLLVDICHNEEAIAKGNHDYVLDGISGWRRFLCDWFSFDGFHADLIRKKHPA